MYGGERSYLKIPEGLQLFEPKAGNYEIDVCPYIISKRRNKFTCVCVGDVGDLYWERAFYIHRNIGVAEETHICLGKTMNKPCPVCEARAELKQQINDPKVKDQIKALHWSMRQVLLVHVHGETDKNRRIMLYDVSNFAFGEQLDLKLKSARPENKKAWANFFDPAGGFTLQVVFTDTPMGNGGSYIKAMVADLIPRKKGLASEFVDHGICLDDVPRPLEYDAYRKLFLMLSDDEEEEDEDASRNGEATDEDEDEPRATADDDDDEDDDEDDEPKPRFEKGDEVEFKYKKKTHSGVITGFNKARDVARVEVDGFDRDFNVDVSDLSMGEPSSGDEDEDEDEDDEPQPRARTRTRKAKEEDEDEDEALDPKDQEEDEDEDKDEDEEDEDDEPKPRRRRARR
jgi:hypothetical protein